MKRGFLHIVIFLSVFLLSFHCEGKKKDVAMPFLETKVNRYNTVEGEKVIYEVILNSAEASVAGVEVVSLPEFSGLDTGHIAPDSRLEEVEADGRRYYRAVVDRFFIGTDTKGKYVVKGGTYRIGINRQFAVNDPFWGPSLATRTEMFVLDAPDVRIQVAPVPLKGMPAGFSGAVGRFDIEMTLVNKEVRAGEDACLSVVISGNGDLSKSKLPEIHKSFGNGLHFKSMTDSMEHYIKNGSLGSEMEIECLFSAEKSGKYTIAPIDFSYFDSEAGKYVTVTTPPLEIDVIDAVRVSEDPPVIMDV